MTQTRNRSRMSQPGAVDASSAFLQCMDKLDSDTFCETLLPMLISHGSAGDLAATCTQLRKLCHSSVMRLNLRPLLSHDVPRVVGQWTQHLQDHFPQCSSVALQVQDNDSYHAVNYVLPALARLPDLTTLEVEVTGPPFSEMLPMAMLLLSLRTQLTSLQSLILGLSQSWAGARLAFAELAAMTELTGLFITSTYEGARHWDKADFLELSHLCDLRQLSISARLLDEPAVCLQLVLQMSALTALKLGICSLDGFSSLQNCNSLWCLSLELCCNVDASLELGRKLAGCREADAADRFAVVASDCAH